MVTRPTARAMARAISLAGAIRTPVPAPTDPIPRLWLLLEHLWIEWRVGRDLWPCGLGLPLYRANVDRSRRD